MHPTFFAHISRALTLAVVLHLAGALGLPRVADAQADPQPRDEHIRSDPRTLQLEEERRATEGRLRTLDRTLESYERDRLRPPPLDQPTGRVRGGQRDPLMERKELERRSLQDRQQQIERDLRQQPYGAGTSRSR